MSGSQFRFAYYTPSYELTITFYRDGLGLPIIESWERSADDRGTLFAAASGIIEVLVRPDSPDPSRVWDQRAAQGVFMAIEVEDIEALYARAHDKGLVIQQELMTQPWGHRCFRLQEPNGLSVYFFKPVVTTHGHPFDGDATQVTTKPN